MTVLHLILAGLLAFLGWAAQACGMFFNALVVFILLMVPIRVVTILCRLFRGSLELGLWQRPLDPALHLHRFQVANDWVFWLLAALTLELCIVPSQFTPGEYAGIRLTVWGGVVVLMLLALLPSKPVQAPTNLVFAAGSLFMAFQIVCIHWPARKAEGVVLSAPFRGGWLVVQGGRSGLINHHHGLTSQRHALDLGRLENGQERSGHEMKKESYFSWGETLLAPADGTIARAVDGFRDNAIGETDDQHLAGNYLSIDMGNGRFVVMAHLQNGSLLVSPGDRVRAGQPIARCGNSGNTSHPHLHLQVQNQPEILAPDAETYPILFRDVTCLRRRHPRKDAPFFVRRNDLILSNL